MTAPTDADTTAATPAATTFACPRCATEVTERFWGPCTACRKALTRASAAAEATEAAPGGYEATRFEPAMHVTPNHVATKD